MTKGEDRTEKSQQVGEAVNLSAREVLDVWEGLERHFTGLASKDFTKAMARLKGAMNAPLKPGERQIITPTGMKVTIRSLVTEPEGEGKFCVICGCPLVKDFDPFFKLETMAGEALGTIQNGVGVEDQFSQIENRLFFTVESENLDEAATKKLRDFFEAQKDEDPDLGKVKMLGCSRGEGDFFTGGEPKLDRVDVRTLLNLPLWRRFRVYKAAGLIGLELPSAGDSRWIELLRPLKGDAKAMAKFKESVREETEDMEGNR